MERTTIEVLEERVANWMTSTTDYRKDLCQKIAYITKKLDDLPCKERGEMYKGIKTTQRLLWGAVGIVFGILLAHLGWK